MTKVDLLFLPGRFKASASISFDFESSAQSSPPTIKSRFKTAFLLTAKTLGVYRKDLTGRYGRGYSNRKGAEKIIDLFSDLNIHGTWFATGHVVMKGNRNKWNYRSNTSMTYATMEAGFTGATSWRQDKNSFCHEPFSDYKKHPFYYLGDMTESLHKRGEDIQCHSFSHPYVAMESPEHLKRDLEDWKMAAELNGINCATIFAFPFLGDVYYEFDNKKYIPYRAPGESKKKELTLAHLDIFKTFGYELFTRCISLEDSDIFKGFKPYHDSDVYCMKDKGLLSFSNNHDFSEYLEYIIENGATIDFWLHPNDVYDDESYKVFYERVTLLHELFITGELWLTTICTQWERFKQIKKIKYNLLPGENNIEVLTVTNTSSESIEQLAFNSNKSIVPGQSGIKTYGHKFIIDKIESGKTFSIELATFPSRNE